MKARYLFFTISAIISLATTAALLTNIADNNIVPNLLDIAAEESVTEITNIVLGSVAIVALLAGITFGLKIERLNYDNSDPGYIEDIGMESVGIGICGYGPIWNIPASLIVIGYNHIISELSDRHSGYNIQFSSRLEVAERALLESVFLSNIGWLVIMGSALAIGFAEDIHQYFLNNTDLPAEFSKALANILTPEHIIGMGIAVIAAVGLPLLHSLITAHKLDISFATPKESMLGSLINKASDREESDREPSSLSS